MNLKEKLDFYCEKYETESFIKDDPIQIPHRFLDSKEIELVGFISALFAFGRREQFIGKLEQFLQIAENKPIEFIKNFSLDTDIQNLNYRFIKPVDLVQFFLILKELYKTSDLQTLFETAYNQTQSIKGMLQVVYDYFRARVTMPITQGFLHLLPCPAKNGALKRYNMFLRWMVRDGAVDFGLWKFINKSDLLIPLDVHVGRLSRSLRLLTRKADDFNSVLELTSNLKLMDKSDPVKYDFALFGFGVDNSIDFDEFDLIVEK